MSGEADQATELSGPRISAPAVEPAIDEMDVRSEVASIVIGVPISDVVEVSRPAPCSSLANVNEDDPQMSSYHDEAMTEGNSEEHENQTDANATGPKKVLKKPDKILPCPRCNSMNTKFCYYNNYNVSQPRHFCKNCHRYWTAGGTMRNVPVGAGKRKSKNSALQHRQLASSHDEVTCRQLDNRTRLKENGTVLEAPLCESMTSLLNLQDQEIGSASGSLPHAEIRKAPSGAYSMPALNCVENNHSEATASLEQNHVPSYCNFLPSVNHLQVMPIPPWVFPWPPGWYNTTPMMPGRWPSEFVYRPENVSLNTVPSHPSLMTPVYSTPAVPLPFFPASFWGCMTSWPNGTQHVCLAKSDGSLSTSSSTSNNGCSYSGSPTLGKHFRDATFQGESEREKNLWFPKTLRIDDPDEAAKSSIWETLGIKPDESIIKGGIFKSVSFKSESKDRTSDAACVLHANPAALSRSHAFQESTQGSS